MITSIKYYITILIASILFVSCSDDINYPGMDSNDAGSQNSVIIQIANDGTNFSASRALSNPVEGSIHDIYAVLVPKQSGDIIVKPLSYVSSSSSYTKYTLKDVYQGSYKIYILANIDDYLEPEESTTKLTDITFNSESDITNLQLYFHADDPIEPGEIPMAATPDNGGISNSYISLGTNSNPITATMSFLCSKVRYTILFDASPNGHSSKFGDKRIEFVGTDISTPYAQNILSSTPLPEKGNYGSPIESGWNMYLLRYNYPADGINYPKSSSSSLGSPVSEWKNDAQRAWQGVIYLPENLSNNKTTLNFYYEIDGIPCNTPKTIPLFDDSNSGNHSSASGSGNSYVGSTTSTGLTRGKMYDVVALVKDPNVFDITVTTSKKYRFYWPKELSSGIILTLENDEILVDNSEGTISENYRYVDFESDQDGKISYRFINSSANNNQTFQNRGILSEFEEIDGIFTAYIDYLDDDIQPGLPISIQDKENTKIYRIWWPEAYGKGMYIILGDKEIRSYETSKKIAVKDGHWYYIDFYANKPELVFKYKFSEIDKGDYTISRIPLKDFGADNDINRCQAFVYKEDCELVGANLNDKQQDFKIDDNIYLIWSKNVNNIEYPYLFGIFNNNNILGPFPGIMAVDGYKYTYNYNNKVNPGGAYYYSFAPNNGTETSSQVPFMFFGSKVEFDSSEFNSYQYDFPQDRLITDTRCFVRGRSEFHYIIQLF